MIPLAVVTGASGGIGREIAKRLGRDGYAVIVHYASNRETAQELVEAIVAAGGQAWAAKADLAYEAGVEELVTFVNERVDADDSIHLRALVNNAGLLLGPGWGDITANTFDAYFALNTRAPILLTQALLPLMGPGSSIVNISSAAAHFASPGDVVYALTKVALEAFARHVAPALASSGVRINTVVPGFTDNGHPAFLDATVRAHMASFAAMGDVSSPEHIAEAVSFLLSASSARTTGVSLDVSGGSTLGARPPASSHLSLRETARDAGEQLPSA